MTAALTLFVLLAVAIVVTKIAAAVLMATGLSRPYARFQARSAFTGVGFTTSEAEVVVNHPLRRRVVAALMLLGNLGLGAVIASLVLSYDDAGWAGGLRRGAVLVAATVILLLLARSRHVDRLLTAAVRRVLGLEGARRVGDLSVIANVAGEHDVVELAVAADDWWCGRTLAQLRVKDEGVLVIGLERAGDYRSLPGPEVVVEADDVLYLYGPAATLADLDDRRTGIGGELAHVDRVGERRRAEEDRDGT